MTVNLQNIPTFGVAGNFTGHLEQAGEARDFKDMKTRDANAPKAIFPTYIPQAAKDVPAFLCEFPFDEHRIIFPKGEQKLQIEPECAIVCKVRWDGTQVAALEPFAFGASNDCSIRKEGAKKISEKKNWGSSSKGCSSHLIPIDAFAAGGILDRYRIASFLVRGTEIHAYGEDSAVRDYSYIYGKLLDWAKEKFNTQQDEGPAEQINAYLNAAGKPDTLMLSIGATRYTDFGEHNFLQDKDVSVVILYPQDAYTAQQIAQFAGQESGTYPEDISVLRQTVTA